MRLNARTLDMIHSPIGAAFAKLPMAAGERPLLDMSQAAPSHPTAPQVAEHVAAVAIDPDGGRYCPQEGLPHLREAFAAELRGSGVGQVDPDDVLITAGCNQAFCLTVSALCSSGDSVVLDMPFYFNHDMWLRLDGIDPVHVPGLDPDEVEASITDRTRAIVAVTPGNPTGVTMSAQHLHSLAGIARRHEIALIVDETYRSFRPTTEAPHTLHDDPTWRDTVVTLHSFSKEFAIPGYRVGAVVAGRELAVEVMKLLDCVAICAPRIGQEAAWAGLTRATEWRDEQAARVRAAQAMFESVMADSPGGFELRSAGAYFGWVEAPPSVANSEAAVEALISRLDVLAIPGSAFTNSDEPMLRMSFANLDEAQLAELGERLQAF